MTPSQAHDLAAVLPTEEALDPREAMQTMDGAVEVKSETSAPDASAQLAIHGEAAPQPIETANPAPEAMEVKSEAGTANGDTRTHPAANGDMVGGAGHEDGMDVDVKPAGESDSSAAHAALRLGPLGVRSLVEV
jgi:hypothetical protein